MKAPVFLLAFVLCGFVATASAATLVVTKTEDTNDGVCDADCSLREAVAAANADDTVVFSSLFNTPQTITLSLGQISITRNVTINGQGPNLLAISGNNVNRIFKITGGPTVNLSGMKLTNGLASVPGDSAGGAILLILSSLSLTNVWVTNNTAHQVNQPSIGVGGGICVDRGTLAVVDSTIDNNTAVAFLGGGGIYSAQGTVNVIHSAIGSNMNGGIRGTGDLSISSNIIVANSALRNNTGSAILNGGGQTRVTDSTVQNNGGGIGSGDSFSTLTIERSSILGNQPLGGVGNSGTAAIKNSIIKDNQNVQFRGVGGGIGNTGTMYILDTAIANNTAYDSGGGIYNVLGHLYVTNSTVSGNLVWNGVGDNPCPGGGIANIWDQTNQGGTVILTNSTVASNAAQGRGGGICNQTGGTVTLRNSIVAQNTGTSASDVSGAVTSEGHNLVGNTAGNSGWIPSDLQNVDPLLAPLGNNGGLTWTHALLPGSPAIGGGNNELARDPFDNTPLVNDQRGPGFMRVVGNVDIGAYEANYAPGTVTVGGRVTTSGGRGIAGVRVTFTSGQTTLYAQTNPFGYYRFAGLLPGTTYEIAIMHKYYTFDTPQYFTADQNRTDLNFTAR